MSRFAVFSFSISSRTAFGQREDEREVEGESEAENEGEGGEEEDGEAEAERELDNEGRGEGDGVAVAVCAGVNGGITIAHGGVGGIDDVEVEVVLEPEALVLYWQILTFLIGVWGDASSHQQGAGRSPAGKF